MKVFYNDSYVNFVDENNVYLGYNEGQSCCESAWSMITKTKEVREDTEDLPNSVLEGYVFDTAFFEEDNYLGMVSSGGSVCFRAIKGSEELFITLINYQNGYYGHGFSFVIKQGEKTIKTIQSGFL